MSLEKGAGDLVKRRFFQNNLEDLGWEGGQEAAYARVVGCGLRSKFDDSFLDLV